MNACTIIARNYLPHARVLAESFLEYHPGGQFTALVIDLEEWEKARESFAVLNAYQIGIDRLEVHRMAMIYDLKEFATAAKPFLLRTLLRDGVPDVTYFDPDIQVFASLDDISALAQEHSIVLTPHTTEPLPRDGLLPDDRMILRAGIYNLGFIAVGAHAQAPFLEWWSARLARDCLVAVEDALFVDQRWIDFVPALFDHYVLRDPTVNVAYWNLQSRDLRLTGERYEVCGEPLRVFHFSGFDARSPETLSAHMGTVPRIRLSHFPDLGRLCAEYAERLVDHGFGASDGRPYRFDVLPDGRFIDRSMRRRFREGLLAAEAGQADDPPNPFDSASQAAFDRWLEQHNASAASQAQRPALRRVVRAVIPRRTAPADRELSRRSVPLPSAGIFSPRRERGVNVIGYLEAELGLGEIARKLVLAAERAAIPTSTVTYRAVYSRQQHYFEERGGGDAPYDTNILCVNANELAQLHAHFGPGPLAGRYTIGVWFWEIAHFPVEMHPAFGLVDEVWVASDFVRESVSAETDIPVSVVPIPLEAPPSRSLRREDLGLPTEFLYLFSFDYSSVFERKNPLGLVEAFTRAFSPGEGPSLVIRSINGELYPGSMERLQRAAARRPDIRVVDGYVSPPEKDALIAACDCYVSLHRSEGLGLTMAEAMAVGKPVIGTAYSGNLTFMDEGNSYLVSHGFTAIPEGCDPYRPGTEWAEPDLDHAAQLMRRVYEHPDEAREVGERARRDIHERYPLDRTAAFMSERLGMVPERERLLLDVRDPLDHAAAAAGKPPGEALDEGSRVFRPRRLLRRVLRRVLWPELADQRRLDSTLVQALGALVRVSRTQFERIEGLRRDADEQHKRIEELERVMGELGRREQP